MVTSGNAYIQCSHCRHEAFECYLPLNEYYPHADGIDTCEKFCYSRTTKYSSTESLFKIHLFLRKMKNCTLNGYHYLKINKTIMQTKMAPSDDSIFMAKLEKKHNPWIFTQLWEGNCYYNIIEIYRPCQLQKFLYFKGALLRVLNT